MRKSIFILVLFFACADRTLAAGGICPAGANYLNPANPTGANVTLATLGVTSCFYIAANGSDSNDGLSEVSGHPWLHAPGMPNCTGTCASTTPAAGNGFIVRGGDTWHLGNSGATPYTGGTWTWTISGTSPNPVYIGVDLGWFSGGSWARPVLNGDNPLNSVSGASAGVASCTYSGGGATLVNFNHVRYYHFDDFELLGMCWGATGGAFISHNGTSQTYTQGQANPNPRWIERNYIHGWSHVVYSTCVGCSSAGGGIAGVSGIPSNGQYYGVIMQFNVIDGADSDSYSLSWCGNVGDTWIVQYNVVRYNGSDNSPLSTHLFHDNLFEWGYNADDGSTHTDWPLQNFGSEPNGGTFPGDGTPNLFYNNIIRHIPISMSGTGFWLFPQGSTPDYMFNDVLEDYQGSGNWENVCQGGCGNLVVFNVTGEGQSAPNPSSGVQGITNFANGSPGSTTIGYNNYAVTSSGGFFNCGGTCFGVTETNDVTQAIGTANGQGYVLATDFSPQNTGGVTVTTSGTNLTNVYCLDSVLHNALAEAACVNGITSVSYNATSHTVVYPAFTPVARPSSGSWNVGAYQFTANNPVPAPAPVMFVGTVKQLSGSIAVQ
jgi:hypothetical protein